MYLYGCGSLDIGSAAGKKISIITVAIWCNLGYHAMLYLAYLQAISNDYYEAAEIDGATWWQKFRYITYPMLAPAMTISLMLLITDSLKFSICRKQ